MIYAFKIKEANIFIFIFIDLKIKNNCIINYALKFSWLN